MCKDIPNYGKHSHKAWYITYIAQFALEDQPQCGTFYLYQTKKIEGEYMVQV